jgi:Tol biopolymer transport system component
VSDDEPGWSPDGTKLVFVRHMSQPPPRGRLALFLINSDGTGERQLTPSALQAADHPDGSPDGKRILFRSNVDAGPNALSNIHTIRPDAPA